MQEIIEHYGRAILAAVTGTLVITLVMVHLHGTGLFGALQSGEEKVFGEKISADHSADTASIVMEQGSPSISAAEGLVGGRSYEPEELLLGGSIRLVRILKITDIAYRDLTDRCLQQDGKVLFPGKGVYRIRLWCEDEDGRAGTEEIWIGIAPGRNGI